MMGFGKKGQGPKHAHACVPNAQMWEKQRQRLCRVLALHFHHKFNFFFFFFADPGEMWQGKTNFTII